MYKKNEDAKERKTRFKALAKKAKLLKQKSIRKNNTRPPNSSLLNLSHDSKIPMKTLIPPGKNYDWRSLSIKQPWAQLIVDGIKTVENRSTFSNDNNEGKWIFIHSSKTGDKINKVQEDDTKVPTKYHDATKFAEGAIIGIARVFGVFDYDELKEKEDLRWGHQGDNCITFDIVIKLTTPVAFPGNIGLVVVQPSTVWKAPKLSKKQLEMSKDELKESVHKQSETYYKTLQKKKESYSKIKNAILNKEYTITYIREELYDRLDLPFPK
jgi:hypothetical protein